MLGLHPSDHRIGKRSVGNILYLGGQITQVNLKFIYSEKATKFCKISTLLLTGTTQDKSKVEISQNFVAFSEYMNFSKPEKSTIEFTLCLHIAFSTTNMMSFSFLSRVFASLWARSSYIPQWNFFFHLSNFACVKFSMESWRPCVKFWCKNMFRQFFDYELSYRCAPKGQLISE